MLELDPTYDLCRTKGIPEKQTSLVMLRAMRLI